MINLILPVTFLATLLALAQTQHTNNLLITEVFDSIHNVSDTALTRLEKQTAEQQEYLLSFTLGSTLFECILLITSSILHVVSAAGLKLSRILPS